MRLDNELLYNFGKDSKTHNWQIINDGVMGGRSNSSARIVEDYLVFAGTISLENNGGFASLRGPIGRFDLSAYDYCEIRFKSNDGRKYELLLENDLVFYLPKYRSTFSSESDQWVTAILPLKDFEISRMGYTVGSGLSPTQRKDIKRIGIILADKKKGEFELLIDYIRFK